MRKSRFVSCGFLFRVPTADRTAPPACQVPELRRRVAGQVRARHAGPGLAHPQGTPPRLGLHCAAPPAASLSGHGGRARDGGRGRPVSRGVGGPGPRTRLGGEGGGAVVSPVLRADMWRTRLQGGMYPDGLTEMQWSPAPPPRGPWVARPSSPPVLMAGFLASTILGIHV